MALAREHHAGVLVLDRDRDVRVALVVAHPHVERRAEALDEVLLEQQRLGLGRRDDGLDPHHARDELGRLAIGGIALEVREDALAQRPRLAHVEHDVVGVVEQVDARLVGESERLRAEGLVDLDGGVFGHDCSLRPRPGAAWTAG